MSEIVKIVQDLMNLPQHLCNACGKCCKIALYRGCLSYEEVKKIAESLTEDPFAIQSTKDFLTIFEPFESVEEARKVDNAFVSKIYERFGNDSKVTFFHCRFVGENKCLIHEDRPDLCRAYPVVSERTIFFDECGYQQQCLINCQRINQILEKFEEYKKRMAQKSE